MNHRRATKLSVNVNKIATLRNTRLLDIPNVVHLSQIALDAGADGITVHPRPDERHIRQRDVDAIVELLKKYPAAEFNIEGNPFHGLIKICVNARPAQATLVPDTIHAVTSNSGWDLRSLIEAENTPLVQAIDRIKTGGCRISLFMDAVANRMPLVKACGADRVELYTEPFASALAAGHGDVEVKNYAAAAAAARELGMGVNAGHDLNLTNLGYFLENVEGVDEVSIGHALIADALEFGLAETVRRYAAICRGGR